METLFCRFVRRCQIGLYALAMRNSAYGRAGRHIGWKDSVTEIPI